MLRICIEFAICLGLILVAGTALSRYGDVIAEKSGLGRSWIGLILLATVTSLPELFAGISAVTVSDLPDIAAGGVMGSCVFNLVLFALLDLIYRKEPFFVRASQGHILSAAFGMIMIGYAGFVIQVSAFGGGDALGPIGVATPVVIILFYVLAGRMIFKFERRLVQDAHEPAPEYPHVSLRRALLIFGTATGVVVAAAIRLPFLAEDLAEIMNWSQSFVGTLFVALTTSAPEFVVTVSAVRMGAIDLAIGNVLGSNMFNIAILGVLDPLYRIYHKGQILANVSTMHAVTAFTAVIMSGIVVVGLLYHPRVRVLKTVGWISIFLVALFLLNSFLLFALQDSPS